MSGRGVAIAAVVAMAAGLSTAPAGAQEDVVPPGVSVGGVSVGGLTPAAAAQRIDLAIARPLARRLTIAVGRRRFSLLPRDAGVRVDARALADQAYREGRRRAGPVGTAAFDLPVRVVPARGAAAALVERVAAGVRVPARNSRLIFSLRRIRASRAYPGRRLAGLDALKARVRTALRSWTASRLLRARTVRVRARVGPRLLRARTGAVVTVSRRERKVRLFSHLRFVKSYRVAVGQPAWPTPTGLFHVQSKQVDPAWSVPRRSWAGSQGGQVIPGGSPGNPLKARWIGFAPGVGFHGTADLGSIGGAQSHGCVRMRVRDVKDLYHRVRIGTPVYVR